MASHIGEKIIGILRHPDNQSRLQSVLDPVVSHIIQRVFPYILLSAILFLILFILTIGTFWIVMRSGGIPAATAMGTGGYAAATAAAAITAASVLSGGGNKELATSGPMNA
jgi:hypothetical protein